MDCDAMPSKCHTYGRDLESMHNGSIEQQVMPHSCDILYGSMCNSCPSVSKFTRPIWTPQHNDIMRDLSRYFNTLILRS